MHGVECRATFAHNGKATLGGIHTVARCVGVPTERHALKGTPSPTSTPSPCRSEGAPLHATPGYWCSHNLIEGRGNLVWSGHLFYTRRFLDPWDVLYSRFHILPHSNNGALRAYTFFLNTSGGCTRRVPSESRWTLLLGLDPVS